MSVTTTVAVHEKLGPYAQCRLFHHSCLWETFRTFQSDMQKAIARYWSFCQGFLGWGDPMVEREVCQKVVECSRKYAQVLFFVTLLSITAFQWSILRGRTLTFERSFCWINLAAHVVGTLLTLKPELISSKTLNWWYCFGAIAAVSSQIYQLRSMAPPDERLLWSVMIFAVFRVPASAITTRLSLVLATNIACMALCIYGRILDTHKTQEPSDQSIYMGIWVEVIFAVLVTALAVFQKLNLTNLVRGKVSQNKAEARPAANHFEL